MTKKKTRYWNGTSKKVEAGDIFKIASPYKKCKYKGRQYIVDKVTKNGFGVWFTDKRTNNKCKCDRCLDIYHNESTLISVNNTEFIATEKELKRNKTIDKLLK